MRVFIYCILTYLLLGVFSLQIHAKEFINFQNNFAWQSPAPLRIFYVDSENGRDENSGLTRNTAIKSLDRLSKIYFRAGDHIYLKRGTDYEGTLTINGDGTRANPIVVGAYGIGQAPRLSNPYSNRKNGNVIQIRGDHQIIQNLHFHDTAPAEQNALFEDIWSTGAVHVSPGHNYAIIRGNYFQNTPKAIHSYSEHAKILHNLIRGTNKKLQSGFLSMPYWGPIGIHLGIGNQTIAFNIIENMLVIGGEWGADGGAIEIDDGRYHKDNIHIHNNLTRGNLGFLEISWDDDILKRATQNILIEKNISQDFQHFVLWWAQNKKSYIRNNTIIRTEQIKGTFTDTVFYLDGGDIDIHRNIVVINNALLGTVYEGAIPDQNRNFDNFYWNVDGDEVDLGLRVGARENFGNPLFVDFEGLDYRLKSKSPAQGLGAFGSK